MQDRNSYPDNRTGNRTYKVLPSDIEGVIGRVFLKEFRQTCTGSVTSSHRRGAGGTQLG